MVAYLIHALLIVAQVAPPAEKMPPTTRATLQMALIAIVLLGLLLVVAILLGGSWVRKWGAHRRGPSVPPDVVLKKKQQLDATVEPTLPSKSVEAGDTVVPDETRAS